MNTTRLPGFSADQALYPNHTSYYRYPTHTSHAATAVWPQLRRLPTWPGECDPTCICVSPIGCPCCISIGTLPRPGDGPLSWIL